MSTKGTMHIDEYIKKLQINGNKKSLIEECSVVNLQRLQGYLFDDKNQYNKLTNVFDVEYALCGFYVSIYADDRMGIGYMNKLLPSKEIGFTIIELNMINLLIQSFKEPMDSKLSENFMVRIPFAGDNHEIALGGILNYTWYD